MFDFLHKRFRFFFGRYAAVGTLNRELHETLLAGLRKRLPVTETVLAVTVELSAFDGVFQHNLEHFINSLPELLVFNRAGDFYPTLGVTRHHICRGDVELHLGASAKTVNPCVFQKPADNTDNCNVFGFSGDAGYQAADAADNQLNRHAALGRLCELIYYVAVGQRVHFHQDGGWMPQLRLGNFLVNFFNDVGF